MKITRFINGEQREVLEKARKTYGDTAQILVSNEELCELAAVCAKYPRYETGEKAREELHDKATDEVADVLIVLDHIINILGLTTPDIMDRVAKKIDRLSRWLDTSDSMEQTTIDREIVESEQVTIDELLCKDCIYETLPKNLGECRTCLDASNYKKKPPCKDCAHFKSYGDLISWCVQCLSKPDGDLFEPIEEGK